MTAVAKGVQLRQESMAGHTGRLFFVDSSRGSDGNPGTDRIHPLKTLTQALTKAEAGDTIVLAPGGSETVTASLAVAVAQLKIVCDVRNPQAGFTITGAGSLDLMTVSGANVHVEGLRFARSAGAGAATAGLLTTAAADKLTVRRCSFDYSALTSSWTNFGIELTDGLTDVVIEECQFRDCHRGILGVQATGTSAANWRIKDCEFWVGQATAFGIHVSAAGTGKLSGVVIDHCYFVEADGDGTSATDVWDGSDNTDANSGPISFGSAVDQYLIANCRAYTALAQAFDTLNAIDAGAAGDLATNATGVGGDTSAAVDSVGTQVSSALSSSVSHGVATSTGLSSALSATVSHGTANSAALSTINSLCTSIGVVVDAL